MSKSQVSPTGSSSSFFSKDIISALYSAALTATALAAPAAVAYYFNPTVPYKKKFDEDVVYVYQFRRSPCSPSLSAKCLALETYLRMANIKYENICDNPFLRAMEDNCVPFVELNGKQYSGTNNIIVQLEEKMNLGNLEASIETGETEKLENAADDLLWCYYYFRYIKNEKQIFGKKIIGSCDPTIPIMPWCTPVFIQMRLTNDKVYRDADVGEMAKNIAKRVRQKLIEKGSTNFLESEIIERGERHLKYIHNVLGNKDFFYERISPSDCIVFGVLAQILYVPLKSPFKKCMKADCKNLISHTERLKSKLWPDWEKILTTGKLNSHIVDKDEE